MGKHRAVRTRTHAAVAAVVAIAAAGTLTTMTIDAASAGASTNASGTATYTLEKDNSVRGPSSLPTGPVILTVKGPKGATLQIFKPNPGIYAPRIQRDAAEFARTFVPTALDKDGRFVGGVQTGSKLQVFLPTGRFYLVDTAGQGRLKNVQVTSTVSQAHRPRSSQIEAVGMISFARTPKSIPASGWLKFTNKAGMTHFIELARMKPGKTDKDLTKAFNGQENPDSVAYSDPADTFQGGIVSPNWGEVMAYKLKPGTYAVLCFIGDTRSGIPHAVEGMHRTIRVG